MFEPVKDFIIEKVIAWDFWDSEKDFFEKSRYHSKEFPRWVAGGSLGRSLVTGEDLTHC